MLFISFTGTNFYVIAMTDVDNYATDMDMFATKRQQKKKKTMCAYQPYAYYMEYTEYTPYPIVPKYKETEPRKGID